MFDARTILDILLGGGPGGRPQQGRPMDSTIFKDMLDQLQGGSGQPGLQAGGGQGSATRIRINRLMEDSGGASGQGKEGGRSGAENLGEALRQVLGQAAAGAREGAQRIDEATGLSGRAREALGQATGQTPEEVVARLKTLIAENQLAAGATLGGLGALVLGTRAGRALAGTAVRLGSLALIGGLAYKAVQNYQQGRPILSGDVPPADKQTLLPAPEGSGFEPDAVTDDAAKRYIRAMIAAAAADGRIDEAEQQKVLAGLKQAGLDNAAERFLVAEISNPATVTSLVTGVSSPEEAVQIYTAARVAVDPDTDEENAFLASLAAALGIDDDLAAQVDAAARTQA